MYAGTTLTKHSGNVVGAHQKIDRVARRHLKILLAENDITFPASKQILEFEGKDGPDGIKRKSPAQDEPWHYLNPFDLEDNQLVKIIEDHFNDLVAALKENDITRAAFLSSWLSHALVDGLTPAHHYPYEQELINLRGGQGIESRNTIKNKLVMPGDTIREQLINNWKMWGTKGLLTTHGAFEFGVASIIKPLRFKKHQPSQAMLDNVNKIGTVELFKRKARQVAELDMYEQFYKNGWTSKLARQTRMSLAPTIISMVTLAWYDAAVKAKLIKKWE